MSKFLIVGLGNPGSEYHGTRHNIGFRVLDAFAKASNISFEDRRYGFIAHLRIKNAELTLLKPTTFMNLSGNAVRYWLQEEKIPLENLLVVVDDLSLPVGAIRMKPGGSSAGHNGLKHIAQILGTERYNRLKFGIGNDYPKGSQVDFVLSTFPESEDKLCNDRLPVAIEAIKAFALSGINFAMCNYNNK